MNNWRCKYLICVMVGVVAIVKVFLLFFRSNTKHLKDYSFLQEKNIWKTMRREGTVIFLHAREVWKRNRKEKKMNIMLTLCQLTSYSQRTWLERRTMHLLHHKVLIISEENVDILPLWMKRPTKDNGKVYIISRCVFWL